MVGNKKSGEIEIRFKVGGETFRQINDIRMYTGIKTVADTMRFLIHEYHTRIPLRGGINIEPAEITDDAHDDYDSEYDRKKDESAVEDIKNGAFYVVKED